MIVTETEDGYRVVLRDRSEWNVTKSTRSGKKWMAQRVEGHGTVVHFGAKGYPDYRELLATAATRPVAERSALIVEAKAKRQGFRSRFAKLIAETRRDPTTPMFWSYHLLW